MSKKKKMVGQEKVTLVYDHLAGKLKDVFTDGKIRNWKLFFVKLK